MLVSRGITDSHDSRGLSLSCSRVCVCIHPHSLSQPCLFPTSLCSRLSAALMRALLCEGHLLMQDTENKINNQFLSSTRPSQAR